MNTSIPLIKGLSKSKYCSGIQCQKKLWLDKYMPEQDDGSGKNDSILAEGSEVGDLAMGLFGEFTEVPYSENYSEMISITQKLLNEGVKNICEASFSYDGCFCSVDILKNLGGNKVELYEVKSSSSVKPIYVHDVSYQYFVLTSLGFDVQKACLVHINNQYIRQGELELNKFFEISDLTETAKEKLSEVKDNISKFRKYLEQETEPVCHIGKQCKDPYICGYWHFCAKEMPKDGSFTVWDIAKFTKAQEYYDNGIITFEQIYNAGVLKGNQLQQVEVEIKNLPPQINKTEIQNFLNTLSYPLYFLDFETFAPAVPLYDNSYSRQKIVFQYSLHYFEKKGGELKHKECLAYPGSDPRRQIAEQLCKDIPLNVCTTAYSMGFEKSVIKNLAEMYPDLREHLMNIHDNIKDIMLPFQKQWYYTKEMQGSYSIKKVLPALYPNDPSLNYSSLEGVHNGGEAMSTFQAMQKMSEEQLNEWRTHLLKYCELDTLAMVKVLGKLEEAVK